MLSLTLLFVLMFQHCDHRLGKKESCTVCFYMLLVHLFVYLYALLNVLFSLPLGVRGWLRLMIVALPGLFC